jgi:hypothetical protein
MVIGALAVGIWGRPRTTLDVDVVILTGRSGLQGLGSQAVKRAFVVDQQWAERNPMMRDTQLRLLHRSLPVDLMLPRDQHDRDALRRKRRKRWRARSLWFVAPEDLILQKLKVGRPRDFEDALSVWQEQRRNIDERHLWKWARRLRIVQELEYVARGLKG